MNSAVVHHDDVVAPECEKLTVSKSGPLHPKRTERCRHFAKWANNENPTVIQLPRRRAPEP